MDSGKAQIVNALNNADRRVDLVSIIKGRALEQGLELDKQRNIIRGFVNLRIRYANTDYGIF